MLFRSNQRVQNANQQEQYNKSLIQTKYANDRGQAQDLAGAAAAMGNANAAAANANAAQIQGITSGIASGLGAYAGYQNQQNKK